MKSFLRSYLVLGVAIIALLAFSLKILEHSLTTKTSNEQVVTEKQQKDDMDTTVILTLLTTIVLLAGMFKNPAITKLSAKVSDLIDENKNQHEQITAKVNDATNSVKSLSVYKDLEHSLAEFVDGELEHVSGELSEFISLEGKHFIETAKNISLGAFNATSIPNIKIQINTLMTESASRATHLGGEFSAAHNKSQAECMEKFMTSVEEIMTDETFNSKHKRFKVVCEHVLHKHLTDSIRSYFYIKTQ